MRLPKIAIVSLLFVTAGNAHATPFADIVDSFFGGSGFGVLEGSGVERVGIFDSLAVTALDGTVLALAHVSLLGL